MSEPIEVPVDEAGLTFKFEMAIKNFLLGFWPAIVGTIGVVLVGFLIYGQYQSWNLNNQRKITAETNKIVAELPVPMPMQPLSEEDRKELITGADKMMKIGEEGRATARVEAYLRAAEAYREAGATDKQRRALEAAADGATGPLRYSALAGLANLDLEAGEADAAIAKLEQLMAQENGFEGEQAALDLGLVLEQLDRQDEARGVYEKFQQRWPESARKDIVTARLDALSAGSGS